MPRILTRILIIALCLAPFVAVSGCGSQDTPANTAGQSRDPATRTYSKSPESTSLLLKDASDALRARYASGEGAHFTMETTGVTSGHSIGMRAEGDIAFPDKARMTSSNYLTPQPVSVDVVTVGGKAFSRTPAGSGAWQNGDAGMPPPDPQNIAGFMDYGRSSRNFGHENINGHDTWDVQVDVDMVMLATDAMKRTSDPQLLKELEALKSSVVTVDFWIGADDLAIYQMLVKTTNPLAGFDQAQDIFFTNWGQHVEITAPREM